MSEHKWQFIFNKGMQTNYVIVVDKNQRDGNEIQLMTSSVYVHTGSRRICGTTRKIAKAVFWKLIRYLFVFL